MTLCMCLKALLSNKSEVSSILQATGLCSWGFGCPGRAIVTTSPMALATARETEGQEASRHNKARKVRRPPPLMVTKPLLRLLLCRRCLLLFKSSCPIVFMLIRNLWSSIVRERDAKKIGHGCRTCMHLCTFASQRGSSACWIKPINTVGTSQTCNTPG